MKDGSAWARYKPPDRSTTRDRLWRDQVWTQQTHSDREREDILSAHHRQDLGEMFCFKVLASVKKNKTTLNAYLDLR